jgi:hypothetical protein
MQIVPIQDVFSQTLTCSLTQQNCKINIYQNAFGLFMDLYVNAVLIIGGVICEDRNRIVRDLYLGFVGDFTFIDTQGSNDPSSPGLGTRYLLCYIDPFDLAPGEG